MFFAWLKWVSLYPYFFNIWLLVCSYNNNSGIESKVNKLQWSFSSGRLEKAPTFHITVYPCRCYAASSFHLPLSLFTTSLHPCLWERFNLTKTRDGKKHLFLTLYSGASFFFFFLVSSDSSFSTFNSFVSLKQIYINFNSDFWIKEWDFKKKSIKALAPGEKILKIALCMKFSSHFYWIHQWAFYRVCSLDWF